MNRAAPSLLEMQRALLDSLAHGDSDAALDHVVAAGLAPEARLAIYRHTSQATLETALRLAYPAVRRLVGEDFFALCAREYLEAHPARGALLDLYGSGFPGFLSGFAPARSLAYLPDVAALEWAVNVALHAPELPPLDPTCLHQRIAGEAHAWRLLPQPTLGLVRSKWPIDAIWHAVLDEDDETLRGIDLGEGPVRLLVERQADTVQLSRMDEGAWRFAVALCAGTPLLQAIEECEDPDPARCLALHLARGHFASLVTHSDPT